MPYPELLDRLLELALERHAAERQLPPLSSRSRPGIPGVRGREPCCYFFRLSSLITALPPSGSSEIQSR